MKLWFGWFLSRRPPWWDHGSRFDLIMFLQLQAASASFVLSWTAGEIICSDHTQILLRVLINLKLPIDDVPLTCNQRDPHTVWGRSCLGDPGIIVVLCPAPGVRHAEGRRADCEDAAEPIRCQVTWLELPPVSEGTEVWAYSVLGFQHTRRSERHFSGTHCTPSRWMKAARQTTPNPWRHGNKVGDTGRAWSRSTLFTSGHLLFLNPARTTASLKTTDPIIQLNIQVTLNTNEATLVQMYKLHYKDVLRSPRLTLDHRNLFKAAK